MVKKIVSLFLTVIITIGCFSTFATTSVFADPVNNAPVANDDNVITKMNTAVIINVLSNDYDVDGNLDPKSAEMTAFPEHGGFENLDGGLFWYGPSPDFVGTDSFTYRISDTDGLSDTAVVTIGVGTTGDHQPVANDDSVITEIDTSVTIDVAANDIDGDGNLDPTTAIATTLPGHGTLTNNGNGTFNYTPESGYHGLDSFYYQISDTDGNSAAAMVTIQVGSPNHSPVANPDYVLTDRGIPVLIDVAANDTDEDGNLDPATAMVDEPAMHGILTNNGNGTFTYSPSPDSYFGPDAFSYYIYDDLGACSWATVYISVGDPASNHPPVANDDSLATAMDTPVEFDVASNDTDEDGNLIWTPVRVTLQPENGWLEYSVNYNGYLMYTPFLGFSGYDAFTYEIRDTWGLIDTAVVTIKVGTGNYLPVVESQAVSTDEDTPVVITLTGLDADGDPLSFSSVSLPNHGTLSGSGAELTYIPATNYNGMDSFNFQANDGEFDSNIAAVIIIINPVNDAPVSQDFSYSTDEDTVLNVDAPGVLTYDTIDQDLLIAVKVSNPLYGTLTLNPDGSFTYTPNADFNGADNFNFVANDGLVDSNVATITITVNWINDAPVAIDDSITTYTGIPVIINVATNDFDVDSNLNPASVCGILGPAYGTVVSYGDGRLEYTPNAGYSGSDTFTYEIWDYYGLSDTAVATITVNMNNPPVVYDQSVTTDEGNPINITLTAIDADGDPLTYVVGNSPVHGMLSGTAPDLTYTPDTGYIGPDNFTFMANDGIVDSEIATVNIAIQTHNVDESAPSTSKTVGIPKYGVNDVWVTSYTSFNLTASDNIDGAGVDVIRYRIWHDGEWTSWIEYTCNFSLSGESKHYIEYYSIDKAGNVEEVHNQTHDVDDTPPSTSSSLSGTLGQNSWYRSNVTVTLTATDTQSGINTTYYKINGGDWQIYTTPFNLTGNGMHQINYSSIDNLGNIENVQSITMKIDKTLPTITITKPEQGFLYICDKKIGYVGQTIAIKGITVKVDTSDIISGIAKVEFYFDNTLKSTDTTSPYQWKWNEQIFCKHKLKTITYDLAGNTKTTEMDVWVFNS